MSIRTTTAWVAAVLLGSVLLGAAQTARAAATRTWTGNGATNNWSDAGNWNSGAPVAGDSLVFPASANRKTNTNNLASNTAFDTVTFNGGGYDISGNAVSLTTDLTNQSNGNNEIHLSLNGAGAVWQQTGRLILSGNNGFTGGVTVVAGALRIEHGHALGNAPGQTIVNDPGTIEIAGGFDMGAKTIYVAGTGYDDEGALQSLSGTNVIGKVIITGDTRIGVFSNVLVIEELQENFGGGDLQLVGGGKLQVETSFFTGGFDVAEGNLTWHASSQVFATVRRDGVLRGLGMVSQVDVFSGMVWPGSGSAPGILSVFGLTTFNSGVFRVDIDGPTVGAEYGRLETNGLTLNPSATMLDLDISTDPSTGDVYRIIDNSGISAVQGTFLDLPEGALFVAHGFVWKISYKGGTGNDVTLTVLRVASADLQLQMTALPSPVASNGNLTYTIVVTNAGPDTASSPTVSMGTPVGTSFVSSTKPSNWTCSNPSPGPTVTCTGPNLPSGEIVTVTLTFKVNAASGTVGGTAGVSSQTNDPASGNNSVTLSTPIGAPDARPYKRVVVGVSRD